MYTTTKAALDMTAKVMAKSYAPKGARVNVVSPEPILTDLLMDGTASWAPEKKVSCKDKITSSPSIKL